MVIPIRDLQEQETNLQKESDKTPPEVRESVLKSSPSRQNSKLKIVNNGNQEQNRNRRFNHHRTKVCKNQHYL